MYPEEESTLTLSPHIITPEAKWAKRRPSPKYRVVRFCEENNTYHDAATSEVLSSYTDKRRVWYSSEDKDRFMRDYGNVTINMEKGNRHRARVWLQTLHLTYQDSLEVDRCPMAQSKGMTGNERLRSMYSQAPELVGIEDVLLPKLRADGFRRQRSLLSAIHHISQSRRMDQEAKDYHIRIYSERISQPSKLFAREIAMAQMESSYWIPTHILPR